MSVKVPSLLPPDSGKVITHVWEKGPSRKGKEVIRHDTSFEPVQASGQGIA